MSNELNRFVNALNAPKPGANAAVKQPGIIKGTVTAVSLSAATISCTILGDTSKVLTGISFADFYTPIVGDNCLMVKMGAELWALGTVATSAGSGSWLDLVPQMDPGTTNFGLGGGPALYRMVLDNGDRKVQLKGSLTTTTAGGNAILTLPAEYEPAVDRSIPVVTNTGAPVWIAPQTGGGILISASSVGGLILDGVEYFLD